MRFIQVYLFKSFRCSVKYGKTMQILLNNLFYIIHHFLKTNLMKILMLNHNFLKHLIPIKNVYRFFTGNMVSFCVSLHCLNRKHFNIRLYAQFISSPNVTITPKSIFLKSPNMNFIQLLYVSIY